MKRMHYGLLTYCHKFGNYVFYIASLQCDINSSFSQKVTTLYTTKHFRGRRFYGKPVIEGVHHPSETIYMPHHIYHAVYNLDKTVAVSDNPFYNTAIEESAFQLFRKGRNGYSYINDSHIYLHGGTL